MESKDNKKYVFFYTGDEVRIKQDIENRPVMVVKQISKTRLREGDDTPTLLGIKCFWFTSDQAYQEATFSSKDLEKC